MNKVVTTALLAVIVCIACNSQRSNTQPGTTEPIRVVADTTHPLEGKKWVLKQLNGHEVIDSAAEKKPIFLQFKLSEMKINGFGGCNGYGGNFELKAGNRIQFDRVISTMIACENLQTENELFRVLESVDNYYADGSKLQLNKAKMAPLAVFEAE